MAKIIPISLTKSAWSDARGDLRICGPPIDAPVSGCDPHENPAEAGFNLRDADRSNESVKDQIEQNSQSQQRNDRKSECRSSPTPCSSKANITPHRSRTKDGHENHRVAPQWNTAMLNVPAPAEMKTF